MSTEHQGAPGQHGSGSEPHNADVTFETRDFRAATIYVYLIVLALTVVATFFVTNYILRYTQTFAEQADTPPPPSRAVLGVDGHSMPPEPRLQGVPGHETDPQEDLRRKMQEDAKANEKLELLDKNAGVAQIPVKDAMKIIAEKGVTGAPSAPGQKK
jgi:hypothetical protein